jgi:hypothetical protein
MSWSKELQGDWVVGSLVTPDGKRPFRLKVESAELVLDDMVGGMEPCAYSSEERTRLEDLVRMTADLVVTEVRLGQYFCHTCKRWVAADCNHWSLGLCLSCSMDRDSDRWS